MRPLRLLSRCNGRVFLYLGDGGSLMIEEDEQQARQAQQEGVEQQRDDVKGADCIAQRGAGGQRHQHLRAVGDDALEDARERVQQGGGALGADAVLLGDLLGDRSCHDDGNGVVGGGDVHESDQQTDADLSAALAAEYTADEGKDALEADTPPPMLLMSSSAVTCPVTSVMAAPAAMPMSSTTNTFRPRMPPMSTSR